MTAHAAAILAAFWFFGTEIPQPAFQVDSVALEKGTFNIRIFEGATGSGDLPSLTSISSFAQAGAGDQGGWEEDPEAQATRIQKAYNLKSVAIIGSGSITLEKGDRGPAYVKLHIPNKVDLSLEFTVTDPSARKFLIEVFEQNEDVRSNILSTEVGLPKATYTIFGFKDLRNNPYFVALQIGEWTVIPAGPVRRIGPDVQPPKLIHRVEPEFPIKAREARVEGTVVLEAQTDIYGRVLSVKVLKSIPLLDQAAIDAVRQWVYEPMLVNGNPQGVVFTVTVRFTLENEKPKPAKERIPPVPDKGPVRAIGQIKPPALRKQVKPVYPEIAAQANVSGVVILEARTDEAGRVAEVNVLRSIPLLDQAAIDAVRQWEYEPMVINGRPREVVFTVTVRFEPDRAPSSADSPRTILTDNGETIQILHSVAPKYPEEAKKAKVEGMVLLEASVGDRGLVGDIRVLRSVHPALDRAAIDAFKDWTFEPRSLPLVGGKTDLISVVVSARFRLAPPKGESEAQFEFPGSSWKAASEEDGVGRRIGGVIGGVFGGVEGGLEGGVSGEVVGGVIGGVIKADLSDRAFQEGAALPPVRAVGDIKPPALVKRVEPAYPDIARANRNKGTVILEIVTDVYGKVISAKVLRSVSNLDQAAIDAVKQWIYKPLLVEGKPRSCIFTVTVVFELR